MKNLIKKIVPIILFVCLLFNTGCNGHTHNYQFFIVEEPTCNKEGKLEGICSCGKKTEQSISASHKRNNLGLCTICGDVIDVPNHTHVWSWTTVVEGNCTTNGFYTASCYCGTTINRTEVANGHKFTDNCCTVCGFGSSVIPQGQTLGFTLDYLLSKVDRYGYDLEDFVNCYIENIKFDALNILHASVCDTKQTANISFVNQKLDFNIITPSNINFVKRLVLGVDNFGYKLNVILADGTYVDYGYVNGYSYVHLQEPKVKSIFINHNNLLLIAYEDNSVKVAGKIATANEKIDGGELIYRLEENSYTIVGTLNENLTKVVVPNTHRGLPVKKINNFAFFENDKITEVICGENIETIGENAFYNCGHLTKVKLNSKLKRIEKSAFYNTKLQGLVLPSSVTYLGDYSFGGNSSYNMQYVYLTVIECNALNNSVFNNVRFYYANQWRYVNGEPTPW